MRVLLSCGEASGDLYAGALTRELRALSPDVVVEGLGGPRFEAAGGRVLADYRQLSVTGLTEAISKIPQSLATVRSLVEHARTAKPDVLVVIDFPDFNFSLARRVSKLGVPVVYYIAPQLWAWRSGRIKAIKAFARMVLPIFPFEPRIYENAGVPVEFVGHPLIDLVTATSGRAAFLARLGLSADRPTVAILPGSRTNEVSHILGDLVAAAGLIREAVPGVQFVLARAPKLADELFAPFVRAAMPDAVVVEGDTDAVLAAADVALTASGTATVQTALHDTPMVIVYRLSSLTYKLGRPLVKLDTFGMVNLIAGERIVPELIQDDFTPEAVAREAVSMLTDPARAATIRAGLAVVRQKLGGAGASRRAAEAVLRVATSASRS